MQEIMLTGEVSAPAVVWLDYLIEPTLEQTAGRRGLTLADVERGERPHRCGRCMNPFLRAGNPECPRLAHISRGQSTVFEMEAN